MVLVGTESMGGSMEKAGADGNHVTKAMAGKRCKIDLIVKLTKQVYHYQPLYSFVSSNITLCFPKHRCVSHFFGS